MPKSPNPYPNSNPNPNPNRRKILRIFCHLWQHSMFCQYFATCGGKILAQYLLAISEVESSRMSLASRTHFEVLGLGIKASNPWPWPQGHILKSLALASKPQVLGLGLKASSPWPWSWSLRSLKIALSSARGQHYFWIVEILLEYARNLAENLQIPFCFSQLEHRRSQVGLPPIELSSMTKMSIVSLVSISF